MEFRCVNAKGDDAGDCDKFAKYYRSLCPGEWVSAFSFAASIVNYSPGECILLSKEHTDDKLDLTPQFSSCFLGLKIMKLSSCFSGCIAMPFVIYLATSKSLPLNNILFNNKSSFSYVTWVKSCLSSVSWLSQWSVVNRLFLWWLFNNILAPAFSVTVTFSCQLVGRTYGRWCACACR